MNTSDITKKEFNETQQRLLNVLDVIQRRKLLFDFLEYCDNAGWIKDVDKKRIIQDYEKAKNCL